MMNTESENAAALPLDELTLTPEWVKTPARSFEKHPGESADRSRRDGDRPRRRDGPPRGERKPGARPPHPKGDRPRPAKGAGGPPRDARPAPAPAPVEVTFLPEEQGFASMIETIKHSPRAYALFDLAKLILNKPERHRVKIVRVPGADGVRPPLYLVPQSDAPFLTEQEALRYIFTRHLDLVAKTEKKEVEPPKGNFTFVNRCGITGEWLGPPNYHGYQTRLIQHHQQRLRHVPFEDFKARIQTVRDEAAVKAWLDGMSAKTEYVCILDAEPKVFTTRAELEKHVVEHHRDTLVAAVHELVITGVTSRQIEHPGILQALRTTWESERRFPLKTVNELRPRLQKEGFYFFKHPNGVTYITHVRLKRFETGAYLTHEVKKLLELLRAAKKGLTIKELLPQIVPAPATPPDPAATPTPAPDEERILADLRWLISDGYVVELSDGRLWAPSEKQPAPPPPPTPAAPPAAEVAAPPAEPPATETPPPPDAG